MPATALRPNHASPACAGIAIEGLPSALFADLFALSDADLATRGIRRVFAAENPGIGYPCRVSLAFGQAGEELLLINHRHLDKPGSPYRSEGPIFVRRNARQFSKSDAYPEIVMQREMAVRAYDAEGMMIEADLAEKEALKALVERWLARPDIAHVDIHSARRGCFFCRIERM